MARARTNPRREKRALHHRTANARRRCVKRIRASRRVSRARNVHALELDRVEFDRRHVSDNRTPVGLDSHCRRTRVVDRSTSMSIPRRCSRSGSGSKKPCRTLAPRTRPKAADMGFGRRSTSPGRVDRSREPGDAPGPTWDIAASTALRALTSASRDWARVEATSKAAALKVLVGGGVRSDPTWDRFGTGAAPGRSAGPSTMSSVPQWMAMWQSGSCVPPSARPALDVIAGHFSRGSDQGAWLYTRASSISQHPCRSLSDARVLDLDQRSPAERSRLARGRRPPIWVSAGGPPLPGGLTVPVVERLAVPRALGFVFPWPTGGRWA
jgi:hypothetical protein